MAIIPAYKLQTDGNKEILSSWMTNEGSFLSHLRIKGGRADGIYRMVMSLPFCLFG